MTGIPKRIIGIDPAIVLTGYSVLDIVPSRSVITAENIADKYTFKLKYCNIVNTKHLGGKKAGTLVRAKYVCSEIAKLIDASLKEGIERRSIYAMIEEPQRTSYKGRSQGKDGGVGRALSIYPVVSVAYYLAGYFGTRCIPFDMVFPNTWQRNKQDEDSKEWSVNRANEILASLSLARRLRYSQSGQDSNIADAINISVHAYKTLLGDRDASLFNL
jgi:hypothetical protein